MGDTVWQPLGDGISYLQAKGGILYRSREGHMTFAPDPDAFATAVAEKVELVMKRAINGQLVDPEVAAAQMRKIAEDAAKHGLDLGALAEKLS
jgi:hypothetical protein